MQEIALLLSSLAGVATAAAVRRIPRGRPQLLSLGASSQIKSQVRSLRIEKDLLAKTISRLYRADAEYSKIQRDKLLSKYQHQLGIVLAKLEKLEQSSQHPDLGPVGDGLITLMDQKLSRLDDRLYELSSRMAAAGAQPARPGSEAAGAKKPGTGQEAGRVPAVAPSEKPAAADGGPAGRTPPPMQRQSLELTTLTRLSKRKPRFPSFADGPAPREEASVGTAGPGTAVTPPRPGAGDRTDTAKPAPARTEAAVVQRPGAGDRTDTAKPAPAGPGAQRPDIAKRIAEVSRHKALPEPETRSGTAPAGDDFDDDDDSDDLDRIKGDIRKVLSKIDQAEVE